MLPDETLDEGAVLEFTRPLTGSQTAAAARHNVGGNRTATLAAKPRPAVVVPC